jgi:PAS domain S-box-containing protein
MSETSVELDGLAAAAKEERLFGLLVESVQDQAIYLLDRAGRVISWNPGAERIEGWGKSEIIGENFSLFYSAAERQAGEPDRALALTAIHGRHVREALRVAKDGRRFWASTTISAIRDEAGSLAGFAVLTQDVTERKEAERRLALLATVFDHSPDGILVIDPEGRIVNANRRLEAIFGYRRQKLLGERIEILLPERFRGTHVAHRKGFFGDPKMREMGRGLELFGRRSDGSEFPVDVLIGAMPQRGDTFAIAIVRDLTERKAAAEAIAESRRQQIILAEQARTAEALRQTSDTLATIIEASPLAISAFDKDGKIVTWNSAAERIYGLSAPHMLGQSIEDISDRTALPDTLTTKELYETVKREGAVHEIEYRRRRVDGTVVELCASGALLHDAEDRPNGMVFITDDVTRRKATEEQLRQAQKMEAVGQLTGGMAHDFNNLLGVVIGNLDLVRPLVQSIADADELVGESLDAALRGAELTRRLLAFSRRQPLEPKRVAINELVGGMVKLLERTLGEDIEIVLDLADDLWPGVVDPSQLEASLANLATNARDAMPFGGRLMITTGNRTLDKDYAAEHTEVNPGDYAMIEVSDTGSGMSPEVIARIFEPFYTTKGRGKGTGLGLSMVFGFMKQSGGHINVYSERGVGTSFRLYLPRSVDPAEIAAKAAVVPPPRAAGETVLAVEDNPALRKVVVRQLKELGYHVLEANGAEAALAVLEHEKVDLLFSDVVMPGSMDGFGLAHRVLVFWPQLKVVLTSGFPEAKMAGNLGYLPPSVRLLSKPYRKEALARQLREALDGPPK